MGIIAAVGNAVPGVPRIACRRDFWGRHVTEGELYQGSLRCGVFALTWRNSPSVCHRIARQPQQSLSAEVRQLARICLGGAMPAA